MDSIWQQNDMRPSFPKLEGAISTDVLVIGGGVTGILCTYFLRQRGVDCILVEADRICNGVTKATTAKISGQHGLIYQRLIRQFGEEKAGLYLRAQQAALEQYRTIARKVDCDFEEQDSFIYSVNDRKILENEADALYKIGYQADIVEKTPLPFSVAGAIRMIGQAQFHPLKFIFHIAKGLPIFEYSKIRELRPDGARTDHATIQARKIIVATHFPFLNKHGLYFLKLYQHRSYVLALKDAPDLKGMYLEAESNGLSFRNYRDCLLLGGGGHRTGKKGGGWHTLSDFAGRYYPAAQVIGQWATQDCMTLDGVPYIGAYSAHTPNLYVATGFNKWGMTSSMVAAMLLCDLVQEKKNEYESLFSPSRSLLRPQLAINAAEAMIGLLTPTVPRCPHMGCALHYNKEEHSWDCSCHGSRFAKNGTLLDNPATDDRKR